MADPRISLKNPALAGLLAYLLPGAGHFYQGRLFKGALYCVCILGTFLFGMYLGNWKNVFWRKNPTNYGYLSQVLVGLPALPAIVQHVRSTQASNQPLATLDRPLSAPFRGRMAVETRDRERVVAEVEGTIHLEPVAGRFGREVRGTFRGHQADGTPVELTLAEPLQLDEPISAHDRRGLEVDVTSEDGLGPSGGLDGSIPRPFRNRFQVAPDVRLERELNRMGKFFELANVFTWIAGLLNILAIWDAVEGPAYGYGDEEEEEQDEDSSDKKDQDDGKGAPPDASPEQPPKSEKEAATSRKAD